MYNEEINYRKNIIQEMIKAFVKLKIVLPVEKEYTIDNVTKAVEAAQVSRQNGKILLCIENNNNIDEAGLEKKKCSIPYWEVIHLKSSVTYLILRGFLIYNKINYIEQKKR